MDAPAGRSAAVVIGGAGGIGGAVLQALVRDRPDLVPWITFHSDEASVRELAEHVPGLRWRRCDLARTGELQALADDVRASASRVAVLAHVALQPISGTLLELGHEQVSRAVATSGVSLLAAVEAFDRLLQPGAAVLYVTSMGARRVVPRYGAVAAAKAAG
ncbi:MAG: SDR family oxidoreductase, partial [Actinomycetota bacterium]|nr:SDR family oxidoreductase [Actinomycetota bacterium]